MKIGKNVFHPYIPAMVNRVEKWLSEMAAKGWSVICVKGWKFTFDNKRNAAKEYFMCSNLDPNQETMYDYYRAKELYEKKKSKINKSNSDLFELDVLKIDSGFYEYRRWRNKYYLSHYKKFLTFVTVLNGLLMVLEIMRWTFIIWMEIPLLMMFLYYAFSVYILARDIKTGSNSRNGS